MSFLKRCLLHLGQIKSAQHVQKKSWTSQSCSINCYYLLNNIKITRALCHLNFNLVQNVSLSYSDKSGVNRSPSPKLTGKRKRIQVICSDDDEDVTSNE